MKKYYQLTKSYIIFKTIEKPLKKKMCNFRN